MTYQCSVSIFVPVRQNLETVHLVVQVPTWILFLLQTDTYSAHSRVPHFLQNSWSKQYLSVARYSILLASCSLTLHTVITVYYLTWILLHPSERIPNAVKIFTCKLRSSVNVIKVKVRWTRKRHRIDVHFIGLFCSKWPLEQATEVWPGSHGTFWLCNR